MILFVKSIGLFYLLYSASSFLTLGILFLCSRRREYISPSLYKLILYPLLVNFVISLLTSVGIVFLVGRGYIVMEASVFNVLMHNSVSPLILAFSSGIFIVALFVAAKTAVKSSVSQKKALAGTLPFGFSDSGLPVLVSRKVSSPVIVGISRPYILIPPKMAEDPKNLMVSLTHEDCHFRRRDNLFGILLVFLTDLLFICPFVRTAKELYVISCEVACDLEAVKSVGKQSYFKALLEEGGKSTLPELAFFSYLSQDANRLLIRIKSLAQFLTTERTIAPLSLSSLLLLSPSLLLICLSLSFQALRCFYPCFLGF